MDAAAKASTDPKSANAGAGCLMLFGLPFALGGLASLWAAYGEWSSGDPQENWWVAAVVGGVFTLAGGGIMAGGWTGRRKMLEEGRLEREHPDRPWMWRPAWAQGRVDADARGQMILAWTFAGFWNTISWITVIAARDELSGMGAEVFLIALFPLTGLFLLAWAVTATLRYRKHGVSRLELSTLPGVVGGRLAGRIETRLPEPPAAGVHLSLDCVRMVRSGKSHSERLVWKTDQEIPASRLSRGWQGVSIPVEFRLPHDAAETTQGSERVFWRLAAHAAVAGVDYGARFEVPVFRTSESANAPREDGKAETVWAFGAEREPRFDPKDASFIQRPSPMGGVEYYFPPRSQKRGAVGTTIFLMIWLAALAAMIHFGISLFFIVIWALFACLIALAALDAALGSSMIRIEGDQIHAAHHVLSFGRTRSIRFGEIGEVKTDMGSTQSESMSQPSRAWWNVKATRKAGGDFLVAQNLRSSREAEWLAEEIRRRSRNS